MPITIRDVPDPFTLASRWRAERPPFIASDAYRQLVHELRRYCSREIAGRSFLIAGHRGAGKTTLVANAFDALLRERAERSRAEGSFYSSSTLRPLPVFLQGPTLLPTEKELPVSSDGTGTAGRQITEMENVLVQITLGLHRAVARTFVEAFREHVLSRAEGLHLNRREMLELAAQLQLELDDYSGAARLREIWRRCGVLRAGVLYALDSPHMVHDQVRFSWPLHVFADQGLRELIGVASVCDAYRRISGKITRKDEVKANVTGKTETSAEVDAKGKELAGPFLAALTGVAVGTGTAAAGGNPQVAAFAGVVTALAGMVAGKMSFSHKRERTASLEDLFIPDLSVATMDRILPVLLDRLRDAGLAPVFIIDELDKVQGLSTRILDMIRRLKKMVAENAFFCFLADRSYFEEMQQRVAKAAYSIEHTYFTHQLFVAFRHKAMRTYLEELLVMPSEAQQSDEKAIAAIAEEQADYAVLPYILLHNAYLHPIDLQRQLAQLRNAEGNVSLDPGVVRSKPRYQLELLMQLAVELQLEQEAMQEELDRRPAFRRLAHDAMYYPSRRWERDADRPLSLGDAGLREFERYLLERMAIEKKKDAGAEDDPPPPFITAEELQFLWDAVQALVRSLASPSTLVGEYEKREQAEKNVALGHVVAALRSAITRGALLEPVQDQPDAYRWVFRRSGRRVIVEPAMAPAAAAKPLAAEAPDWKEHVATVRGFEAALRYVSGGTIDPSLLSTGMGILPSSPAWPQVQTAMTRLATVSEAKPAYPEMEDDRAVVQSYDALLAQNIDTVALSLEAAKLLSAWGTADAQVRLRDALQKIAFVLALDANSPADVRTKITELRSELRVHFQAFEPEAPEPGAGAAAWIRWIAGLAEWSAMTEAPPSTDVGLGWAFWRRHVGFPGDQPPPLPVLIQAVRESGAFAILKAPTNVMTLREWSLAFFHAINGTAGTPPWVAFVALGALRWGLRSKAFLSLWKRGILFPHDSRVEPEIEHWITEVLAPRHLPQILVSSQPGALTESWKPDPSSAALVLRRNEWTDLQRLWASNRDEILTAFDHDYVAIDASGPAAVPQAAKQRKGAPAVDLAPAFADWFGLAQRATSNPVLVILDDQTALPVLSPRYRSVRNPKSLAEAIVQAGAPAR